MINTSPELYEISTAFNSVAQALFPLSGRRYGREEAKTPPEEAVRRLEELTGLGVSAFTNNPRGFISVAEKIVREKVGMSDGYVLHSHKPWRGSGIRGNTSYQFWVNELTFVGVDTQDLDYHHKLCCVGVDYSYKKNIKAFHIVSKPFVVSPFSELRSALHLQRYVHHNPYGFFAQSAAEDDSLSARTELEEVARVIGDMTGAERAFSIKKGDGMSELEREVVGNRVFHGPFTKAHEDSVMFYFKTVSEADAAYPTIVKAWEVANSSPDLIEDLIKMRKEMYYADDLFVHDRKDWNWAKFVHDRKKWAWANHALSDAKTAFDKKLGLVAKTLWEREDGTVTKYRQAALVDSFSSVEARINTEIQRRNEKYLQAVREFQRKITGSEEVDKGKFLRHIEKPRDPTWTCLGEVIAS